MMCLTILKARILQNSVSKIIHSDVLRPFSLGFKSLPPYKIYSNEHETNNGKFENLMFGIGSGVGLAVLLGILYNNKEPRSNISVSFEKLKNAFSLSAATTLVDKKDGSPRTTFNFLADVVEKTQNSVVYIEITARHPLTRKQFPVSNGSGFIVKEDGLILTNAHVVSQYGHVVVKLYDGREFSGTVENVDTESDLATVRIQAKNLPELPLGSSSDLRPGEFVIAMGNPLTLSHTITAGVVSSTNRHGSELGLHKKTDYIQTDAAINVGNSGGPLVNLDGEVIGINTMKVTEGISFAIPSDRAIEFLKKTEQKSRSLYSTWNPFKKSREQKKTKFLGIGMLTLSPVVIKNLKERNPDFPSVDHGVLVWKVMIGSPSYESGIRAGDVITHINGTEVKVAETVQAFLEKEDVLNLTVHRGQKSFEISVPLVETIMP